MTFSRFQPPRLPAATVALQNRLFRLSAALHFPLADGDVTVVFPHQDGPTCTIEVEVALAEHRLIVFLEDGPVTARLCAEMDSFEWAAAANDIRAMLVETWFEPLFFQFEQMTGLPLRCIRVNMEPSGLAPFLAFQQPFFLQRPDGGRLLSGMVGFNESNPQWFAELLEAMPRRNPARCAQVPLPGRIEVTRLVWAEGVPALERGDVLFPERLDRPTWRHGARINIALSEHHDVWTLAEPPEVGDAAAEPECATAIAVDAGEVAVTLGQLTSFQVGDTLSRPKSSAALQLRQNGVLIGRAVPVAVFGRVGLRVEEVFRHGNA